MNYIYPKSTHTGCTYTPHKIEESKIEKLKQKLKLISKCDEQIILQTEYFYRDLVKIEIDNNEIFVKKKTFAKFDQSQHLHVIHNIIPIEKHNFPNLNSYHNIDHKEIHKFGNILLIKTNSFWTICVQCNNKKDAMFLLEQIEKVI